MYSLPPWSTMLVVLPPACWIDKQADMASATESTTREAGAAQHLISELEGHAVAPGQSQPIPYHYLGCAATGVELV